MRPSKWRVDAPAAVRAILAVMVLLALCGLIWVAAKRQAQVDALSESTDALRQQVERLGGDPVAPPAREQRRDPTEVKPSPVPPGRPGANATDAQVRTAVERYFRARPVAPGRPPTAAEITVAVVNYLRANPPAAGQPGPPPTANQVATAVRGYLTENPPPAGAQGERGESGEPGRPPTAEEIANAVQQYMTANPPPYCPEGSMATRITVLTTDGPQEIITCQVS